MGDPVNPGTGNEFQVETDYIGVGSFPLVFKRTYNSASVSRSPYDMAAHWTGPFGRAMVAYGGDSPTSVAAVRPGGKVYQYKLQANGWVTDPDITDVLTPLQDGTGLVWGWTYTVNADGTIEEYDGAGRLLRITARNTGLVQNYSVSDGNGSVLYSMAPRTNGNGYIAPTCYGRPLQFSMPTSVGLVVCVTDSLGRQLNFTYDAQGRISQMADPAGGIYGYGYDAVNNLISVTYPDGATRQYSYNEAAYTSGANLPNALTGITDENGKRFATISYDAQGRAIATQHAGGVEAVSLSYGNNVTTVIDALNTARSYNFQTILGVARSTGQNQPGGSGCSAASSAIAYDANGNVASRTDFNGIKTTYVYAMSRNLEASRTEAAGTPQARTITSQWHAQYPLPTLIAEPKRITSYDYDPQGNLLTKTIQATSDLNGAQGAAAPAVGAPRIWRYTYNTMGQVRTATGPRTDVDDTTAYDYDETGIVLTAITNAAGHQTALSNYDANGRAAQIVDANGVTTGLQYSPRGWLLSRTTTAGDSIETVTYTYDAAGQMTSVTLPDNSSISYIYDDAHRLTDVTDSLGDSIHYTLDVMGNRLQEQVKDPVGTLARQTTRVYDALNRLQQITGGTQ